MLYVCLLGTAQLLKPWSQDTTTLIFCPTWIFAWYSVFITATAKNHLLRDWMLLKGMPCNPMLKLNFLELEVPVMSSRF